MANSKISALTAATTPVAGTETLPIVQGSVTKQVSIANLTAGRAVSAASLTLTGSPLAVGSGGTGQTSWSANGVLYASGTTTLTSGTALTFDGTNLTVGNNPLSFGGGYVNITTSGSSGGAVWVSNLANTGQGYFAANGAYVYLGSNKNIPVVIDVNGVTRTTFDTSGNVKIENGNLVQGTAAKGINFTANTGAAGKTSQLLNWYEEGTATATITAATGTVTLLSGYDVWTYTRVGNIVHACGEFYISSVSSPTGAITINGLPFASKSTSKGSAAAIFATGLAATVTSSVMGYIAASSTQVNVKKLLAGSAADISGDISSGSYFFVQLTYQV